jgi:hypothetical protein
MITREVGPIVERIRPILAGHPAPIQGAALADCVAIWLAGHHVEGDEDRTRTLRAHLLADLCHTIRRLVPVNAKIMGTTL